MTGHGVDGTIATFEVLSSQLLKVVGMLCSTASIVLGSKILSVPHLDSGL